MAMTLLYRLTVLLIVCSATGSNIQSQKPDSRSQKRVECNVESDIAVIVDSSESVTPGRYEVVKQLAADIIGAFAGNSLSRELGIVYSHEIEEVLPFNFSETAELKKDRMLQAPFISNIDTRTGDALLEAVSKFKDSPRDVPRSLVLITDGSLDRQNELYRPLMDADRERIRRVTVGYGSEIQRGELRYIASSPDYVYISFDYEKLGDLLEDIVESMCQE